jgi:hypothetical protein
LYSALSENHSLAVDASPFVVSNIALVDGKPHIFFVSFSGIVPHGTVKPSPETSASVTVAAGAKATLSFLPFLGVEQTLVGERAGDKLVFYLPAFDRGAVVRLNDSK